jgi:hypothetical protein
MQLVQWGFFANYSCTSAWVRETVPRILLAHKPFAYRESSQIQFTSQAFPPSGENDCSMREELGEMLSQT